MNAAVEAIRKRHWYATDKGDILQKSKRVLTQTEATCTLCDR